MSVFEQVAVSDLKFRVIVGTSTIVFAVAFVSVAFELQSRMGMLLGALIGIIAAILTATVLLWKVT